MTRILFPLISRFHHPATFIKCLYNPLSLRHVIYNPNVSIKTSSTTREIFNVQDADDFKKRVLESSTPVLIDFHAKWCGPCKILGPRLETIISTKSIHMAKVDIDEHTELAMEYEVTAVPSVIGIRNGQEVDRFIGVLDDDKLITFIEKLENPTD